MSTVYNLEPQPTAKCILHTSSGDLELELFAQQTPLASRNFLQHCLDGYYDNTIFHRLVPDFILQGGDPSGSGSGGQSALDNGRPFVDEFHSRLKFNRRGLLGMANGGARNDNGSQFFLTLGKTDELNGKHTMFGRIVGDTIYNLVKMGEAELLSEASDRPMYPTMVTGAEVLVNPFEDMVPKMPGKPAKVQDDPAKKKAKKKRKVGKQLLSFGDDEDEEAIASAPKKSKANPNFLHTSGTDTTRPSSQPRSVVAMEQRQPSQPPRRAIPPMDEPMMRATRSPSIADDSSKDDSEDDRLSDQALSKAQQQIEDLKRSLRQDVVIAPAKEVVKKSSALEAFIPATATRGRKRKAPGAASSAVSVDEQKVADQFKAFQARIKSASKAIDGTSSKPAKSSGPRHESKEEGKHVPNKAMDEEDGANVCDLHFVPNCQSCKKWDEEENGASEDDDTDLGWMSHKLTFAKDRLGKDLEWRKQNEQIVESSLFDPKARQREFKAERKDRKGR